jgi:hypothetical protein
MGILSRIHGRIAIVLIHPLVAIAFFSLHLYVAISGDHNISLAPAVKQIDLQQNF